MRGDSDNAPYVLGHSEHELARLEDEGQMTVQIVGDENTGPEHLVFECSDADGRDVKFP